MLADTNLFHRCGQMLIDRHGENAELHAAQEHDLHLTRGDVEGMVVWKQIINAFGELRQGVVASGERVH